MYMDFKFFPEEVEGEEGKERTKKEVGEGRRVEW